MAHRFIPAKFKVHLICGSKILESIESIFGHPHDHSDFWTRRSALSRPRMALERDRTVFW